MPTSNDFRYASVLPRQGLAHSQHGMDLVGVRLVHQRRLLARTGLVPAACTGKRERPTLGSIVVRDAQTSTDHSPNRRRRHRRRWALPSPPPPEYKIAFFSFLVVVIVYDPPVSGIRAHQLRMYAGLPRPRLWC